MTDPSEGLSSRVSTVPDPERTCLDPACAVPLVDVRTQEISDATSTAVSSY